MNRSNSNNMSIVFKHQNNVLLCHSTYINRIFASDAAAGDINDVNNEHVRAKIKDCIFDINVPFSKQTNDDLRHRKGRKKRAAAVEVENEDLKSLIEYLSSQSQSFLRLCQAEGHCHQIQPEDELTNCSAQSFLDYFRTEPSFSKAIGRLHGENALPHSIITYNDGCQYLIPPKCKFYNRDIRDLDGIDLTASQYDLVVIDPPWWNKYIRRSRHVRKEYSYEMLTNDDIKNIPIENCTTPNGTLVAIWCTNSPTLIRTVLNEFLPKWNLQLVATWYWVKITKTGETIREFNLPLKKQPFEHLFIACHVNSDLSHFAYIEDQRIFYSVPSIIHSQKPPLLDILLPNRGAADDIRCLEIFARYLLPNYTSIGLEVYKLQNTNLFEITKEEIV